MFGVEFLVSGIVALFGAIGAMVFYQFVKLKIWFITTRLPELIRTFNQS